MEVIVLPQFFDCTISVFVIMGALDPDRVECFIAFKIHHKPLVSPAAGNLLKFVIRRQNSIWIMSAICNDCSGPLRTEF